MRIPPFLAWGFVIVSCVAGLFVAAGIEPILDSTATASSGNARVWVHTPFVAPGDRTWLSVEASDVLTSVRVLDGDATLREWSGSERDFAWIDFPVPDRTGPVQLVLEVGSHRDRSRLQLSFLQGSQSAQVPVEIVVRSVPSVLALRLGSLLLALAFWMQAIVGMAKAYQWMRAVDDQGDANLSEGVGGALCVVGVAYAIGGYWAFVLPLYAATRWIGSLWALLWMAVWIVGPLVLGWKLRGWLDRPWAHRFEPGRTVDVAAIATRLRDAGIGVRRGLGWMRISEGDVSLWVRERSLAAGDPTYVWRSDEPLFLRAAVALAGDGAIEVVTWGHAVRIEPDTSLDALRDELAERRRREAEQLLERLKEMGELMDGMRRFFEPPG
ncbi:MAG: hypothetical protein R3F61_14970 [Myxococcota bacterium]